MSTPSPDYAPPISPTQERQLEPRYRRVLSFGELLDESIGLFRHHWAVFALVSAVLLIPPGLVTVAVAATGHFDTASLVTQFETGTTPRLDALSGFIGALLLIYVVSVLFVLAWTSAVLVTTDEYVHGVEPKLGHVLSITLERYLPMFLSACLFVLAMIVLATVATLIFVLFAVAFPYSLVAILAAIVGGVVWWLQPTARSVWLKWLIILATPFGLVMYVGGALSMYLGASVLERHGPIGALRRSVQLVDRHWFRTVALLMLAGAIVSVLQYIPAVLVQLPLTINAAIQGRIGLNATELAITTAAGIVAQVLFASMATIVYAVLFIDLRNRREGTDLAERLSQIEAADPLPAHD